MTSHFYYAALTTLLTLAVFPGGANGEARDRAKQAAAASNQLGVDLYGRLAAAEKGNLFLSPYSIETALAMTYAEARGPTATEMAAVLHLDLLPQELHDAFGVLGKALNDGGAAEGQRPFELVVANGLWAQKGYDFNPTFFKLATERYGAGIESLDFAKTEKARETINAWIAKQTRDKIKDLLGPGTLSDQTRLVLTNAIYFKSAWDTKFSKSMTKDEPFNVTAGSPLNVPTMHRTGHMAYAEDADAQALELPYLSHRLSMVVLLPRKADGLAAVEKTLSPRKLENWSGAFASREVELSLPKFTFTSRFNLSDTLSSMGMKQAFTPLADFTGIASGEQFFIGDVIHQAFVDVNEDGTEAAAATAVVMTAGAARPMPTEKVVFRADHPFLFLIRDNESGAVLFMGRVMNPK